MQFSPRSSLLILRFHLQNRTFKSAQSERGWRGGYKVKYIVYTWFKVGNALLRQLLGEFTVDSRNRGTIHKYAQARLTKCLDCSTARLIWWNGAESIHCSPARDELNESWKERATTRMSLALLNLTCYKHYKHKKGENFGDGSFHFGWFLEWDIAERCCGFLMPGLDVGSVWIL